MLPRATREGAVGKPKLLWGWGGEDVTAWFLRLLCAAWADVRVCAVCVLFVCAAVVTRLSRRFSGEFDWALLEAFCVMYLRRCGRYHVRRLESKLFDCFVLHECRNL